MADKIKYTRRQLREAAFRVIFSMEFNLDTDPADYYECYAENSDEILTDHVKSTFLGVCGKRDEIDTEIEKLSENWKISRMSTATKTALRLAIYEMSNTDVPAKVAINEAIELLKIYDDAGAPSFANGILNKYARSNGYLDQPTEK